MSGAILSGNLGKGREGWEKQRWADERKEEKKKRRWMKAEAGQHQLRTTYCRRTRQGEKGEPRLEVGKDRKENPHWIYVQ